MHNIDHQKHNFDRMGVWMATHRPLSTLWAVSRNFCQPCSGIKHNYGWVALQHIEGVGGCHWSYYFRQICKTPTMIKATHAEVDHDVTGPFAGVWFLDGSSSNAIEWEFKVFALMALSPFRRTIDQTRKHGYHHHLSAILCVWQLRYAVA